MKKMTILAALAAIFGTTLASSALASADLARSKNCMACHAIANKVVGPAFKDVAKRYAGQADIDKKLAEKILKGSSGAWGVVPMPANAQVSPAEAQALAQWILTLK